jgi:membrane protein
MAQAIVQSHGGSPKSGSLRCGCSCANGLIVLLLWVYYSAQIFLLGAEFTKVYANTHGSKKGDRVG